MNQHCAHCNSILFHIGVLDERGVFGKYKDDPSIHQTDTGFFTICPHCNQRVIMDTAPAVVGIGFVVSSHQEN